MSTIDGCIITLRPCERGFHESPGRYTGLVLPGPGLQISPDHFTRIRDVHEQPRPLEYVDRGASRKQFGREEDAP